jgi:hypothetical protein
LKQVIILPDVHLAEKDPDIGVDRPSKTIQKSVGCGHIYCTFIEHKNGNFYKLLIDGTMTKESPCGSSWLNSIARILTYAIRRSTEEDNKDNKKDFKTTSLYHGVIKQLVGHNCNVRSRVTETSCAGAIASAIKDYVRSKG